MATKSYYKAQEKQGEFHFSDADEVLYGGAAGGGKSYSILWDAVMKCIKYKSIRVTIFRRKFPELEKSIILEFLEHVPSHWYEYNKKEHRAYFSKTKSILEFNHCQLESDVYNYQSAQYEFLYFDELTHFTEYIYTYLASRCRTTKDYVIPQIKSASNPGNIGHHWVKARFIDGAVPNKKIVRQNVGVENEYVLRTIPKLSGDVKSILEKNEYTTEYIPAKVFDNKYIIKNDPKYIARLLGIKNASERKALLEGDWDSFEGQFFKEWDYTIHTCEPFEIPHFWTHIRCIDWGYTNPSVCLWIAIDPKGRAFVYRELTMTQSTIEEITNEIRAMTGKEKIAYTTADPSIWSVNQYERGESVAMKMIRDGISLMKADNNRIAGWNVIHSYLYHNKKEEIEPKMQIFNTCYQLIKTLPGLVNSKRKPEDIDTDGDDHHADALRYGLMTKPILAQREKGKTPIRSFEYWMNKKKDERAKEGYAGSF